MIYYRSNIRDCAGSPGLQVPPAQLWSYYLGRICAACLLLLSGIIPVSLLAQTPASKRQIFKLADEQAPSIPDTICIKLKNGRKLIFVDHEGARQRKVDWLEGTRPRALSWDMLVAPAAPNEYYFINGVGNLESAFNINHKNFVKLSALMTRFQCRNLAGNKPGDDSTYLDPAYFSAGRFSRYRNRKDELPGYIRVFSRHYYSDSAVPQLEESNGLTGLINYEGSWVLPLSYKSIQAAGKDFLVSQNGKWGVVSKEKEILVPFQYDEVKQPATKLLTFYKAGALMCSYQTDDHSMLHYKDIAFIREDNMYELGESEARPLTLYRLNDKVGFADSRLRITTPAVYAYATAYFRNGLSAVCRDGKWGYVNASGKEQIPCRFDDAMPFENSLAVVHLNGRRFCINEKGEEVSSGCEKLYYKIDREPTWRDTRMDGQPFRFAERGTLKGVLDQNGKIVIPFIYESGHCLFKKYSANKCRPEYAVVKRMGKWGILRNDGVEVVPCMYDQVHESGAGGDLYIMVQKEVRKHPTAEYHVGLIDDQSFETVLPCEYEALSANSIPGHITFKKNGKWGWMTAGKNIIAEPIYDDIGWMREGRVTVTKNGLTGMLNSSGRVVVPLRYQAMGRQFTKGLIPVSLHGKWGYADTLAREMIPVQFSEARDFGRSIAAVKVDNMYGFIDSLGKAVTAFDFEYINHAWEPDGLIEVKKVGKFGFADESGKLVIPCIYDDVRGFNHKEGHLLKKNGQLLRIKRPGL